MIYAFRSGLATRPIQVDGLLPGQRVWRKWLMTIPIENATDTPETHKAAFCSVRFPLLRLILRIAQTSMVIANNGNT